jgi:type I restriction enzyme S subunit
MELKAGYKQTEVGVIPKEWEVYRLEEITNPSRPISYGIVQTGPDVPNGVPCLRVVDIQDGRINQSGLICTSEKISKGYGRTVLKTGDLVMPLRGKVGDIAEVGVDLDGANLTRGVALVSINTGVNSRYLKFYVSWGGTRGRLEQSMNGSALQEIPIAALRSFQVVVPSSNIEQQAIAETLIDMNALIESLEQLLTKKRQIKEGAMQELLTGVRRLPGFSGEWVEEVFGELAGVRSERIDPRRVSKHEFCVELEHIGSATGHLLGHGETSEQSALKSVFYSGDVLFGKLRAYLRKYWLAEKGGVCSTEIWCLYPKGLLKSNQLLFQLIQMSSFIEVASMAYGTHMPRSDWKSVKDLVVKLPSDEMEQLAIAEALSTIDSEISSIGSQLQKARHLKQGMMQELLTGRIRLV